MTARERRNMSVVAEYVRAHPGCGVADLRDVVDGDNADVTNAWLDAKRHGLLVYGREGGGDSGRIIFFADRATPAGSVGGTR